jgi:hypothetical protein
MNKGEMMTVYRTVEIERSYGEVGSGSSKREDWAWEVTYLEGNDSGKVVMDRLFPRDLTPAVLASIEPWVAQGKLMGA